MDKGERKRRESREEWEKGTHGLREGEDEGGVPDKNRANWPYHNFKNKKLVPRGSPP